jgi:hypothetical protein
MLNALRKEETARQHPSVRRCDAIPISSQETPLVRTFSERPEVSGHSAAQRAVSLLGG